jgi:hypothetical protein
LRKTSWNVLITRHERSRKKTRPRLKEKELLDTFFFETSWNSLQVRSEETYEIFLSLINERCSTLMKEPSESFSRNGKFYGESFVLLLKEHFYKRLTHTATKYIKDWGKNCWLCMPLKQVFLLFSSLKNSLQNIFWEVFRDVFEWKI